MKLVPNRISAFFQAVHGKLQLRAPRINSLRFEISVIYTLILAVILFVFSGVIYIILSRTLYAELDNEVRIKAEEIADNIKTYLAVKKDQPGALQFAAQTTITHEDKTLRRWWYIGFERSWFKRLDEQDLSRDYINFVTAEKTLLVHSRNLSGDLLAAFLARANFDEKGQHLYDLIYKGQKLRVTNYVFADSENRTYLLQVGISPAPVVLLLQNWMNDLFISIPIILILTSFIGRLLASRIFVPIERITHVANTISYKDLSRRIERQYPDEEIDALILSFNDMISRLEKSFKHIENFSGHVAHELKTPLTIMRGETELALMNTRSTKEYVRVLKINLEEIEEMLKVIEDLLFLTKLDYRPDSFQYETFDFIPYFAEFYEHCKILAIRRKVNVRLDMPTDEKIIVKADKLHLRRLFFNLIDNAIKFSAPEGHITLEVRNEKGVVFVSFTDTGVGIPSSDLIKIFDRFYTSKTDKAGSGLGLSIASAIAKVHGGQIDVASEVGRGSTFTVRLPIH